MEQKCIKANVQNAGWYTKDPFFGIAKSQITKSINEWIHKKYMVL